MIIPSSEPRVESWFSGSGPDEDVVVSSRVRLSRNIDGYPFPVSLTPEESAEVQRKVERALDASPTVFRAPRLGGVATLERRVLVERNLLSSPPAAFPNSSVYVSSDEGLAIVLNEQDHIRIVSLQAGNRLTSAYEAADRLDSELEDQIGYAVSLRWGYLSSEIANSGTAMRVSAMLHLPALTELGELAEVVEANFPPEVGLKRFPDADGRSRAAMFLLSNRVTLGLSERSLIDRLEDCLVMLVHYERKARERLLGERSEEVNRAVEAAFARLSGVEELSDEELFELLSLIRFGIAAGLSARFSLKDVTKLFFIGQRSHVIRLISEADKSDMDIDEELVNKRRAKLVRETLYRV